MWERPLGVPMPVPPLPRLISAPRPQARLPLRPRASFPPPACAWCPSGAISPAPGRPGRPSSKPPVPPVPASRHRRPRRARRRIARWGLGSKRRRPRRAISPGPGRVRTLRPFCPRVRRENASPPWQRLLRPSPTPPPTVAPPRRQPAPPAPVSRPVLHRASAFHLGEMAGRASWAHLSAAGALWTRLPSRLRIHRNALASRCRLPLRANMRTAVLRPRRLPAPTRRLRRTLLLPLIVSPHPPGGLSDRNTR